MNGLKCIDVYDSDDKMPFPSSINGTTGPDNIAELWRSIRWTDFTQIIAPAVKSLQAQNISLALKEAVSMYRKKNSEVFLCFLEAFDRIHHGNDGISSILMQTMQVRWGRS